MINRETEEEKTEERAPPTASGRQRITIILVAAALLSVAGAAAWLVTRTDPDQLYVEATKLADDDPAASEQRFKRAIRAKGGSFPDAQMSLSCLLARRDRWDEAVEVFESTDKTLCRSDLLLEFARTALAAKRKDEALAALEAIRQRRTAEAAEALDLSANLYFQMGKQEQVISAARELTEVQPNDPNRWWAYIQALKAAHLESQRFEATRAALTHSVPADFRVELEHQLIEQLIARGDTADAWKEVEKLEQLAGHSTRLETQKIELYRTEGKPGKALELITAIFPQVEEMPDAHLMRGVVYLDLGKFEEAAKDLQRVVAAQPFNERAHFKLSEAYRLLGQEGPAQLHRETGSNIRQKRIRINDLMKKLETAPDNPIYSELAKLHRQLGENEMAQHWQQRASAAD